VSGTRNFGFLRLMLAACVLFQHNQALAFGPKGSVLLSLEIGSLAVIAFFVISGIIVVGAAERFYASAPGRFLSNRFMRIFPAYLAILVISYLVLAPFAYTGTLTTHEGHAAAAGSHSAVNFVANIFYALPLLNTMMSPSYAFLEIVWAVRTEFLFYCAVSATLLGALMLTRGPLARWSRPFTAGDPVKAFRLVLCLVGVAAVSAYTVNDIKPFFPFDSIKFVPAFALGTAFCYALKGSRPAAVLSLGLFALTIREILHQPLWHPTAGFMRNLDGEALIFTGMIVIMLLFAALPLVSHRLDRICGDVSYPVYVGHLLPVIILCSLGALHHPRLLWMAPSLLATALLVAAVSRIVEAPTAALRARIRKVDLEKLAPSGFAPRGLAAEAPARAE
jgi:peptidoglycan/LPS O-acetylase OafA/YrhL